jgi:hypothetical protein
LRIPSYEAVALSNLGVYLVGAERFDEAAETLGEALAATREHNPGLFAGCVLHAAQLGVRHGFATDAARALGYVDRLLEDRGSKHDHNEESAHAQILTALRAALDEDRLVTLLADGRLLTDDAAERIGRGLLRDESASA